MKLFTKNTLTILSATSILILNGCSAHNSNVVSVSDTHLYNSNYGIQDNYRADAMIQEEIMAINNEPLVDMPLITDPSLTTEITKDPDAFYADEYVQKPEVITYKYKFDKKFYSNAEWRSME